MIAERGLWAIVARLSPAQLSFISKISKLTIKKNGLTEAVFYARTISNSTLHIPRRALIDGSPQGISDRNGVDNAKKTSTALDGSRWNPVPNHPIPNDDLGDWGESQFRSLCASAGLVANKAERDKMGWDFIVEVLPAASVPTLTLDQRPKGLGCRVQIKTHWRSEDDDRFAMTLSSAERLAKEPGPSFVLVLTAERGSEGDDPKLVECHLIHMVDDNLKRVLKRLRETAADPQAKSLAEQTISYSPKLAGQQLPPKGQALRDALIRACGADSLPYFARKDEQLKTLGYESGRPGRGRSGVRRGGQPSAIAT